SEEPAPPPPANVPTPVRERAESIRQAGGQPRYFHNRHGGVSVMDTAGIGRRSEPTPLPPVTQPQAAPIREQPFAAARADMDDNGPLFEALEAIKREFARLPNATVAPARCARTRRDGIAAAQAGDIANWFRDFGVARA